MLRLLVIAVIVCMIRYNEFTMAMDENPCSEFSYATFKNIATYLDCTHRRQLNDYNDPKIREIIVANDYQISQQKIDVIKHGGRSAIIYYDDNDNFVIVACKDNKIVNTHTKVQRYTTRKKRGSRSLVPCDVKKMQTVPEDDVVEECSIDKSPEFAFVEELNPDWYSCQDDGTL